MAAGRAQGFTTAITDIDTSAQEFLGMIRFDYNKAYKYVQFNGTAAVAVGDVVYYVLTDANLNTVDTVVTAIGAGVAPAVHVIGQVTFGWLQIRGVATMSQALTSGAAGNALTAIGATTPSLAIPAADTSLVVAVSLNTTTHTIYCLFPD